MDEELFDALRPVVDSVGLELVDVERRANVLVVTVDRSGGVDLDALTTANRAVSRVLDELDPIPGRYSLEVSSPGLERTLRTPAQFARAMGETVTVKTRPQVPGERRLRGRLLAADEEGFELEAPATDGAEGSVTSRRLSYRDVDRVRTVFEWGAGGSGGRPPGDRTRRQAKGKQGGKQVVNR